MGMKCLLLSVFTCLAFTFGAEVQKAIGPVKPKPAQGRTPAIEGYSRVLEAIPSQSASAKSWRSLSSDDKWQLLEDLDESRAVLFRVIGPVPPKTPPKQPVTSPSPKAPPAPPPRKAETPPDFSELQQRLNGLQAVLEQAVKSEHVEGLPASDEKALLTTLKKLERGTQQ
jgi:hypothetical protein